MFTNLNLTDMETCYKVFRTDILKRSRSGRPLRARARDHRQDRAPGLPGLRGADLLPRAPVLRGQEDRLEGRRAGAGHALAPTDVGLATLHRVDRLKRYARFQVERMRPWLQGRTLEIGSGTGAISKQLIRQPSLVVSDPRADYRDLLQRLFGEYPHVEVVPFTLGEPCAALAGRRFETVVCANVLEHVEDDVGALRQVFDLLEPGGRVLLVVPLLRALYGEIDRAIHHFRRYGGDEIAEKLAKAGFEVEHREPLNALGIPGWWLNSRVLRRRSVPGVQARINDWLVPLLRLERRLGLPFGMSLLAVGRKPAPLSRGADLAVAR
jgi:SAM-dependent methyltransferase